VPCCAPGEPCECASDPDSNGDGPTDVIDVQCAILAAIWETGGAGPLPTCLGGDPDGADVDCNGTTNVVDVQITIFVVLGAALPMDSDANDNGCPDLCESLP
jgi:hypothetical protein